MERFFSVKWLLLALVVAVVLESIWLPINVTRSTLYGTIHYDDHEYVWALYKPANTPDPLPADFSGWDKEPHESLNVTRYAARTGLTLACVLFIWLVVRRYGLILERHLWLAPLGLYVCVALMRFLYVPCTWTDSSFSRRYPEIRSGTLPVWTIGTEEIRYGLLLFHEFVLLVLLVAAYGAMFVAVPSLRFRFLGRMRWKRFVD